MRNVYIAVIIFFIISVVLFVGSFFYLDKTTHKIYSYNVNLEGHDIGSIKIDRYETEDKVVYKSFTNTPLDEPFSDVEERVTLDKQFNLESYSRESSHGASKDIYFIENEKGRMSFVSTSDSRFLLLRDIPVRRGVFVFDEKSPVTYLPILKNYNFQKGRSQGFSGIIIFSPSLPPMKKMISLTSIKDEYIEIDSRKIKTENLLVKIRNYPLVRIWVAKYDRSLVALEIPEKYLTITRTNHPKKIEPVNYTSMTNDYLIRDVTVKSRNAQLAGTFTAPKQEGSFPAVLLVCGSGYLDRQCQGLFSSIADSLTRNGFCVLRMDKRGTGSSSGSSSSTTGSDEISDIEASIEYLLSQKEVDAGRIAIIGQGKGAIYACKAASQNPAVKSLILLAPLLYSEPDELNGDVLKKTAAHKSWSDEYLGLMAKAIDETRNRVRAAKFDWTYICGRRCYVKNMREDRTDEMIAAIRNIRIPVLILQGKEDEEVPAGSPAAIDKILSDNGNNQHHLRYYGYLGKYFGKRINDGIHKVHYEVDLEVVKDIVSWLTNTAFLEPDSPPAATQAIYTTQSNSS